MLCCGKSIVVNLETNQNFSELINDQPLTGLISIKLPVDLHLLSLYSLDGSRFKNHFETTKPERDCEIFL